VKPCIKAAANLTGQLKLHRSTSRLLDHHGSAPNLGAGEEDDDLQLHQIPAARLAVDCKIKQRSILLALL
jgi:hypothetical protein